MSKKDKQQDLLRVKAEARLANAQASIGSARPAGELLHELQVHQIELEMQNDELRRTRADLEEAHDRYVDLYEFAPVGYLTLSHEAHITAINLTGAALLGEERKKLLRRSLARIVAPEDRDRWQHYFKQATNHVDTQIGEITLLRKDGTRFEARLDSRLISTGAAAPVLAITLTDITEQKRLDQVLRDQNADLVSARNVAEAANLAKSTFLSGMSHELRTPLNAILGFAQLLEAGQPPPTVSQGERLDQILKAGWYLLKLINEVLDLAAIESGKLSLSLESVPLTDVVRECRTMTEAQARQRGIRIDFLPFDAAWHVYADQTRLKQVLVNLLSNAIKYNRRNGSVEVGCTGGPERVRIRIKDSGVGLPEDKLAQLFQPFNRLGQERGSEEGTGIGLVVTKQLVELMGGSIGVTSRPGVGSEFWIELRRDTAPQPAATPPAALASPAPGDRALRTLLYVEDNPANLMLVEHIISGHPRLRLLSARDGALGVALARAHRPDVILMDINLPGISGIEAMAILRADPATRHIPIIALSANAMLHDIERGLGAGFSRYLTKPIRVGELMRVLDEVLGFADNSE